MKKLLYIMGTIAGLALLGCTRPPVVQSTISSIKFMIPNDTTHFCKAYGSCTLFKGEESNSGDLEIVSDSATPFTVSFYGPFGISVGKIVAIHDSMNIAFGTTAKKVALADSVGLFIPWGAGLVFGDLQRLLVGQLPDGWKPEIGLPPISDKKLGDTITCLWKTNSGWCKGLFDTAGTLQKCKLKSADSASTNEITFSSFKASTPTEIEFVGANGNGITINYSSIRKW